MKFQELGLMPELLRAVTEAGYQTPTPIQAAAIPPALQGKDILGCAQTGTGKTAAFSLPALQKAAKSSKEDPKLTTLILTPTRELAAQINDSLETYGKHLDLWHTVIFGGVKERPQIEELKRGIDILVATPGRLLDLMNRGFVKLDAIEFFVLDEADRMLDMGFIHDVKKITKVLPTKRQTLFFSATMPPPIAQLARGLLSDPVTASVTPVSSATETVTQSVYFTDKGAKRELLEHLLTEQKCQRTVVFTRTKHGSDRVARHLEQRGRRVAAIHGNKAQNARTRALNGFKDGSIDVLVATDIAARGIDVDGITHVINFDIPNIAETYVHRIGRTGRAGQTGAAFSLCDHEERDYIRSIERLMNRQIPAIDGHPYPQSATAPPPASKQPPRGGGRSGRESNPRGSRGGGQNSMSRPGAAPKRRGRPMSAATR